MAWYAGIGQPRKPICEQKHTQHSILNLAVRSGWLLAACPEPCNLVLVTPKFLKALNSKSNRNSNLMSAISSRALRKTAEHISPTLVELYATDAIAALAMAPPNNMLSFGAYPGSGEFGQTWAGNKGVRVQGSQIQNIIKSRS